MIQRSLKFRFPKKTITKKKRTLGHDFNNKFDWEIDLQNFLFNLFLGNIVAKTIR